MPTARASRAHPRLPGHAQKTPAPHPQLPITRRFRQSWLSEASDNRIREQEKNVESGFVESSRSSSRPIPPRPIGGLALGACGAARWPCSRERLSNVPRLRKLGQASGDAPSIEVQALGHLASRAPGMLAQELDDARLGVNLAGARGCTTSARSPSGGAAPRPSWCPALPVVVRVELLDLLFDPGETLLELYALGFERVDHLLNAGQVLLLLRRDPLGLGPETCCVSGTSTRAQDDAPLAGEVRKCGMCCKRWYP